MNINIFKSLLFWKKLNKNLLIGLAVFILIFAIFGAQTDFYQKGIKSVVADTDWTQTGESIDYGSGWTQSGESSGTDWIQSGENVDFGTGWTQSGESGNGTGWSQGGESSNGTSGWTQTGESIDYGSGWTQVGESVSYYQPQTSQPSTWEGAGCNGANSVWGVWTSDGNLINVETDYGNRGECGVSVPTAQTQPEQTWEGPGCNGNRSVWGVWSADGLRLINTEVDYGVKTGECNNPFPSQITPSQAVSPQRVVSQQVPMGNVSYSDNDSNSDSHNRSTNTSTSTTRIDSHNRTIIDDRDISGSYNRDDSISGSYNDSHNISDSRNFSDSHNLTTTTPSGSTGNQVVYQPVSTNPGQEVVYRSAPVVRYADNPQVQTTDTSYQCPPNTTKIEDAETITCVENEDPKVVQTAGDYQVKELPKTGLPLAAVGLLGLIPAGLRMKKFGKNNQTFSANSVWESREFGKSM